ncbi:hypothetical protein J4E91_008007 [Alternaria rosae]|nr:hypothetical protein J4E91_008007 [Alternaria rosae]
MRHSLSKTLALGLLSAYILHSSGKPIIPIAPCQSEVDCKDPHEDKNWPHLARTDALPPALDRRASGGGRPNKPNDNSPNAPHPNPNEQNTPSDAGDQQGESGGFSNEQETSGGFSDSQETEGGFNNNGDDTGNPGSSSQPAVPDPDAQPTNPNAPPNPNPNPNVPAANNPAARLNDFRGTIAQKGLTGKPWMFYSGLDDRSESYIFKETLEVKTGQTDIPYMENLLPLRNPQDRYFQEYDTYKSAGERHVEYYFAANSKAYAQAVDGDIYALIKSGTSVNQPYPGKGSNWWTFEVPELTRNARVNSITVVPVNRDDRLPLGEDYERFELGDEKVIWRRGDEPIGFPADELHGIERPSEPWETLPDVEIPE